jgi:hypothetical protein
MANAKAAWGACRKCLACMPGSGVIGGRSELRTSQWVKAPGRYRVDAFAEELEDRAEHHQTDSGI